MMGNKQIIAEKIKDRLFELFISRKRFATMMNVQPSMVTKWLSGKHNFTVFTLFDIEKTLNFSLFNLNSSIKMKKFRKKPVVIEAEQFVVYQQNEHPISKMVNGVLFPVYKDDKGFHILIPTLEGTMRADNLDWIIRGVNGELYPCKPDVFEKTYEPAN
jgi:transcriptional regulator with XRE-family HTH domain